MVVLPSHIKIDTFLFDLCVCLLIYLFLYRAYLQKQGVESKEECKIEV